MDIKAIEANRGAFLSWFTGKAHEKAAWAYDQVLASARQGFWVEGARSVKAALDKGNRAIKLGRACGKALEDLTGYGSEIPETQRGYRVSHLLRFPYIGGVARYRDIEWDALLSRATTRAVEVGDADLGVDLRDAINEAERLVREYGPLADAVAFLDSVRPKPVVTRIGASPTVTRLLQDLGLPVGGVEVCDIEWRLVETPKPHYVGRLKWPEGTKHGRSRYNWTQNNAQCQACGHAIKNGFNWVPLVLTAGNGDKYSLWVGKDCAKTIFGVEVKGEVEVEGRI